MLINALPSLITRGYNAITLDWLQRTDKRERYDRLYHLDNLVKKGTEGLGWLNKDGELFMLGMSTRQACLEGLKGNVSASEAVDDGNITYLPDFGVQRQEGEIDASIEIERLAEDWPGVSLNSMSIGVFITTNELGTYMEAGFMGTAGNKIIAIRGSSGFRGGSWLNANQIIQGGTQAVGWHCGSRTSADDIITCVEGVLELKTISTAATLPNHNFRLLSVEPGNANSPNRVLMCWVGEGLSALELSQQFSDIRQYVRDIGTFAQIQVPPFVLGPNCFEKASISQVIPSTMRIMRQQYPPASDAVTAAGYPGYPNTDTVARFFIRGNMQGENDGGLLDNDPIQVTNASRIVVVKRDAHDLIANRDVVELSGIPASVGGIDPVRLNNRHIVSGIVDANHFEITMPVDVEGTSTASGGGATVRAAFQKFRDVTSTYTHLRNGRFNGLNWSARGDAEEEGGSVTGSRRPNDIGGAPIQRRTDHMGGSPRAGTECRPGYRTHRRAAGSTVVTTAHLAGMPDRGTMGVPALRGYLDWAEIYDLDPDKVIHWREAYVRADELFTEVVEGYATSYDYVILQNGTMANAPNFTAAKKGVCFDTEHADFRAPELMTEMWTDISTIMVAVGMKACILGHNISRGQAVSNAWTLDNTHVIADLPGLESINIMSTRSADPAAAVAYLEEQVDMMRGPAGTIAPRYDKILLSCTLGNGSSRVPLDQCAAIGDWARSVGINMMHVRRAASREGGVIEHEWNQQQIAYFPNLAGEPALSGQAQADAWLQVYFDNGGAGISDAAYGHMVDLFSTLIDGDVLNFLDGLSIAVHEDELASRIDWRTRTVATFGAATAAPAFTANQGWSFDGVNDYVDHGVAPSAGTASADNSLMIGVFRKSVTAANSVYAAGAVNSGNQALRINPRLAISTNAQGQAATDNGTFTIGSGVTTGLYGVQYDGTNHTFWVNGAQAATRVPSATSTRPTRNVYSGGFNNNNTPAGFKAGTHLATVWGAHLDTTKWTTLYNALVTYFTARGALP